MQQPTPTDCGITRDTYISVFEWSFPAAGTYTEFSERHAAILQLLDASKRPVHHPVCVDTLSPSAAMSPDPG